MYFSFSDTSTNTILYTDSTIKLVRGIFSFPFHRIPSKFRIRVFLFTLFHSLPRIPISFHGNNFLDVSSNGQNKSVSLNYESILMSYIFNLYLFNEKCEMDKMLLTREEAKGKCTCLKIYRVFYVFMST